MDRHRPIVMGANGMVASGHPLATAAGLRVLQDGGNAFDAAIAAAAVVAVCEPSANSIGGHNLALIWDARRQELAAMDANGPAPAAATPDRYTAGVPEHGPLSVSVPGVVAGWDAVLSRHGTRRLADLLEPAIGYAERGFPANHLLPARMTPFVDELRAWPATSAVFLPHGRPPAPAELLRQPDLARSLRTIAKDGAQAFYQGDIAQRIGEFMATHGGLLAATDMTRFEVKWRQPAASTYRGVDCYWQPPPSQGFINGQELNIFEGFEPGSLSAVERLHLMVEAKKLAFADRTRYLCDPDFHASPVDVMLSKEHASRQRGRIASTAAATVQALELVTTGGDTTYLCAVDRDGNVISFIQSVFSEFGSYLIAGDTGVLLNNRMLGFSNEPGHPNAVEPLKRPVTTLNPCMLFRDGRPWVAFGTPGRDTQVQTNFQNVVHWVDDGLDVQSAIEAPRWRHEAGRVLLEGRFGPAVAEGLRAKGHEVVLGEEWAFEAGGAQAIMIDHASGVLQGGADPRREGYAAGF